MKDHNAGKDPDKTSKSEDLHAGIYDVQPEGRAPDSPLELIFEFRSLSILSDCASAQDVRQRWIAGEGVLTAEEANEIVPMVLRGRESAVTPIERGTFYVSGSQRELGSIAAAPITDDVIAAIRARGAKPMMDEAILATAKFKQVLDIRTSSYTSAVTASTPFLFPLPHWLDPYRSLLLAIARYDLWNSVYETLIANAFLDQAARVGADSADLAFDAGFDALACGTAGTAAALAFNNNGSPAAITAAWQAAATSAQESGQTQGAPTGLGQGVPAAIVAGVDAAYVVINDGASQGGAAQAGAAAGTAYFNGRSAGAARAAAIAANAAVQAGTDPVVAGATAAITYDQAAAGGLSAAAQMAAAAGAASGAASTAGDSSGAIAVAGQSAATAVQGGYGSQASNAGATAAAAYMTASQKGASVVQASAAGLAAGVASLTTNNSTAISAAATAAQNNANLSPGAAAAAGSAAESEYLQQIADNNEAGAWDAAMQAGDNAGADYQATLGVSDE